MKPVNRNTNSEKWLPAILSVCMVLLVTTIAAAQLFTANNVIIVNSTQITVKGDIQNNAGTVISNTAGTIDLTGNWTNNSGNNLFGVSTGTVIMNGVNQLVNGNTPTLFNNLNLINGTKTLDINTTVGGGNVAPAGALNCNNAVFDLNSNVLTVNNTNGAAITNTTGYILSEDANNSSKVTWKINSTTGVHTIPFGNTGGVQIPYSFNLVTGIAGDVTVSTYATAADNTPYPFTPTVVTHVRNAANVDNSSNTVDRFWQVDKTGNGTANYTFTYAPAENAANGNINVRAQHWNTGNLGWDAAVPAQLNPTMQSVFVPGVNVNGVWALALTLNPLPVELLAFDATAKNNKTVVCSWTTASELNNDYFTLERSRNGINFEKVDYIKGNGTTNIQHNYAYEDKYPYQGLSYYRIKQTDFNGNYTYSMPDDVEITTTAQQYLVYPNPSAGEFTVAFNAENNKDATVTITDASGRKVKSENLFNASGFKKINLGNAASGFYFLKIVNGNEQHLSKIQVIH